GWHRPAAGHLLVNGAPLDRRELDHVRSESVWVDPSVHIWNRTLLENVQYGAPDGVQSIRLAVGAADLREVLQRLTGGWQTGLGEGGGLVSGGEAQRVRLARGVMRADARL